MFQSLFTIIISFLISFLYIACIAAIRDCFHFPGMFHEHIRTSSFASGALSAQYALINLESTTYLLGPGLGITTLRSLSWFSKGGLAFVSCYVLCIHVSYQPHDSLSLIHVHFQLLESLSTDVVPIHLCISTAYQSSTQHTMENYQLNERMLTDKCIWLSVLSYQITKQSKQHYSVK